MTESGVDRRRFLTEAAALAVSVTVVGSGHPTAAVVPATDWIRGLPVGTSASTLEARRLSWDGVQLQVGRRTILIDPWITPSIWGGAWIDPVVPLDVVEGPRHVLITHLHNDHFDPAALRQVLDAGGSVVCHAGIAATVASRGFRAFSLDHYQAGTFGDFTVVPVPASDGLGENQVSWIVMGGGRKIIHCGDTIWHAGFYQIGKVYGPFDAAFLPINGARVLAVQPRVDVPMTLTPEQAVAAGEVLQARLVVPMHYGVHDPESYLEHPNAEAAFMTAASRRDVGVERPEAGDWLRWEPRA